MSKLKSIPKFKTEAEELRFWEAHDSTDYVDWSKGQRARFPNLRPSMYRNLADKNRPAKDT